MNKYDNLARKDDNIIQMRTPELLTGVKPPEGKDWLTPMELGVNFLISVNKNQNTTRVFLQEYTKTKQEDFAVGLTDANGLKIWVDPKEFCKLFDLFETLNTPEEGE